MSKIYLFTGSDNSGKTTITTQLALNIAKNKNLNVIVLLPHATFPKIKYMFPFSLNDNYSLKTLFNSPRIDEDICAKAIMQNPRVKNVGFVGFTKREEVSCDLGFTKEKMKSIILTLTNICDYLIIVKPNDCMGKLIIDGLSSFEYIPISVTKPDFKSYVFMDEENVEQIYNTKINVINNTSKFSAGISKIKNMTQRIPYCEELQKNETKLAFFTIPKDKEFQKSIEKLRKHLQGLDELR
ncbi:MAG: hypothetical protein MJ236_02430 [Clostridia bacterium]|nr:hypothetical protein [Clostridia bacterium]